MPQQNDISEYNFCVKWMWRQSQNLTDEHGYEISFTVYYTLQIHTKRILKYRLIKTTKDPDKLCTECEHHLVSIEDSKTSKLCKYIWLRFIWFLLKNSDIKTQYGSYIWIFIYLIWWNWWITNSQWTHGNININTPSPILIDHKNDIQEWNELIEIYNLTLLETSCNKHLMI